MNPTKPEWCYKKSKSSVGDRFQLTEGFTDRQWRMHLMALARTARNLLRKLRNQEKVNPVAQTYVRGFGVLPWEVLRPTKKRNVVLLQAVTRLFFDLFSRDSLHIESLVRACMLCHAST
jgi:hypothetical protein